GCTTCIGNSGPLEQPIVDAINQGELLAAAVLSGNRNFEGRVSPHTHLNYLASPPLVVAYALAGTVDIDFEKEPLGTDTAGKPVFLRDVWPTSEELQHALQGSVNRDQFLAKYADPTLGPPAWQKLQ